MKMQTMDSCTSRCRPWTISKEEYRVVERADTAPDRQQLKGSFSGASMIAMCGAVTEVPVSTVHGIAHVEKDGAICSLME